MAKKITPPAGGPSPSIKDDKANKAKQTKDKVEQVTNQSEITQQVQNQQAANQQAANKQK